MDLKNLVWTVENKVGLVVSDYEADQNIVSFMVDTTAADPIVQVADLIDETVRGQVVVIERFDGTNVTAFSVENPVISVVTTADGKMHPAIPEEQKLLDGKNTITEINVHELGIGTEPLNSIDITIAAQS